MKLNESAVKNKAMTPCGACKLLYEPSPSLTTVGGNVTVEGRTKRGSRRSATAASFWCQSKFSNCDNSQLSNPVAKVSAVATTVLLPSPHHHILRCEAATNVASFVLLFFCRSLFGILRSVCSTFAVRKEHNNSNEKKDNNNDTNNSNNRSEPSSRCGIIKVLQLGVFTNKCRSVFLDTETNCSPKQITCHPAG